MARITIFAKGNSDVRDALHLLEEGGAVVWNGINTILRERFPGVTARVVHETMTRSDALLAETGAIPAALADHPLDLGPHPLPSQFATRLFDLGPDIVVLSIQPDVMNQMARSRADGHWLHPYGVDDWSAEDRSWLGAHYAPAPPLDPEQSMANLAAIVARLREAGDPRILIFNMSPIVPWERVHDFRHVGETLGTRIRRFNLALVDLSRATGISIVDVDGLVARAGADRLKLDAVTLSAEGCRLVAQDVVRILEDLGCLTSPETVA